MGVRVVLAVSCLLASCAPLRPVASMAVTLVATPTRIIDAHAHLDRSHTSFWDSTQAMQKEYSENGVVGAVIHAPLSDPIPPKKISLPDKRVVVCGAVNPGGDISVYEQALREGRIGCLKVYLGYVPRYANDPQYHRFYRLAEKRRIPVVFHTGDTSDKRALVKFADPLQIDEIAVKYPAVTFVVAHLGNPWVQSAAQVAYKNDNVFIDLSALMVGELDKASLESIEELIVKPIRWAWLYIENPKKLMFGSDWPLVRLSPYIQAVSRAIESEYWDQVFYSNAAAVFGF